MSGNMLVFLYDSGVYYFDLPSPMTPVSTESSVKPVMPWTFILLKFIAAFLELWPSFVLLFVGLAWPDCLRGLIYFFVLRVDGEVIGSPLTLLMSISIPDVESLCAKLLYLLVILWPPASWLMLMRGTLPFLALKALFGMRPLPLAYLGEIIDRLPLRSVNGSTDLFELRRGLSIGGNCLFL